MRIGIDISQVAYYNTGVSNYLLNLIRELVKNDENEFVLFFSSLRRGLPDQVSKLASRSNVEIVKLKLPLKALDLLWNKLHVVPVETFVGKVDLFITSDWTEPPTRHAKKATIIYDLIVYKNPDETDGGIVRTQKRKLSWVKKESDLVFAISESTKKDAADVLGLDSNKISVIYPGI